MNWAFVFICRRLPTWIPKGFFCMSLHNLYKKIVGFLNFTHNALIYVYLSIGSNFSNALNDMDVVCKSILLCSLKILLLISPKWTIFEGVKDSIGNGSRIYVFSIQGHGKLNQQMAWFFFLQVFLWQCVWTSRRLGALLLLSHDIYLSTKFSIALFEPKP